MGQQLFANGLFTLAKFVGEIISNFAAWPYLPWPPWAVRHR